MSAPADRKPLKTLGAFWKPDAGTTTKTLLKGTVTIGGEKFPVFLFANDKKTAPNHPDFRIVVSTDRDDIGEAGRQSQEQDATGVPF